MVMFTNHKWKEIWWAVGEKTSKMSISGPITCVLRSFLLGTWTCSTSGACHLPPAKRATFSSTRLHGREGGQGRVGAAEEAQQETATWTTGKSPTCHVPWTLWAGAFQWLAAVPSCHPGFWTRTHSGVLHGVPKHVAQPLHLEFAFLACFLRVTGLGCISISKLWIEYIVIRTQSKSISRFKQ